MADEPIRPDEIEDGIRSDAVDRRDPGPPRGWRELAQEALLLLPNLVKLIGRLLRDPRVPIRRKVFLGAVAAYVVSPVDLIPDFVVGFGKLDDIVLVSLAIDHLMRGADADIVVEHWDGSIDGLDLVRSVFSWGAEILPETLRNMLPR
ncbi:MAG: DUF1232 domain-containing protein [Acidimicrobiia bacterium]|nr:DUF1232 domain-containing protein [Acidimicrobiia bacterium]